MEGQAAARWRHPGTKVGGGPRTGLEDARLRLRIMLREGLLRGQLHALGCEEAAGAARACQKRETALVMSCKHRRSHGKRRQGLG